MGGGEMEMEGECIIHMGIANILQQNNKKILLKHCCIGWLERKIL
jgi:hypothetical protein